MSDATVDIPAPAPAPVAVHTPAVEGAQAGGQSLQTAGKKARLRAAARGRGFEDGTRLLSPRTPDNSPSTGRREAGADRGAIAGAVRGLAQGVASRTGAAVDGARAWAASQGRAARDAFVAQGPRGPKDVQAPTGIGGFEVAYDPAAGEERVRIGTAVDFRPGLVVKGGEVVATHDELKGYAREMKRLGETEISAWQWTGAEKKAFLSALGSRIQQAWSHRFLFHCALPGWEDVQAVNVFRLDAHAGARRGRDHLVLVAYKIPDWAVAGIGVVRSGPGPKDTEMDLSSRDVLPRTDGMLSDPVWFRPGSAALDADARARLSTVAISFKRVTGNAPILRLRAAGEGPRPRALARARFDRVRAELVALGVSPDRIRFEDAGRGAAVEVVAGSHGAQTVATHEFGHALGLGDEYATDPGGKVSGTGGPAGTATAGDGLARSLALPGVVHENTESVMSLGQVVRPVHATTFLWALRDVTAFTAWAEGPGPRPAEPQEGQRKR